MILVLILYFLFATTFIIAKQALYFVAPMAFIGFRMLLGGIILCCYKFILNPKSFKFKKEELKFLGLLSIIHIFLPYALEFWALKYVTAAKTSLLFNLSPFITAIFAYFLFKEHLNLKKIIGLTIGFLGFIPILVAQVPYEDLAGTILFLSIPEICIIISVATAAYAWLKIQQVMEVYGTQLIVINGISMIGGGLISVLTSLIFEKWNPVPIYDFNNFLIFLILMIFVGNIICYNLYGMLLKRYTATFLSFAGFLTPVFTAILQFIFFKTYISINFFITLIIVSIGLYIFYQEELSHGIKKT